jgi:ATP-dependent DNA helicase RecG
VKKVTTVSQLQALIKAGETEALELKKSTGELEAGFKDIASLLNHKGGHLVFGVDPKGTIIGQQVVDKTLRDIADEVFKIEPAINPEQTQVRVKSDLYCIVVNADPDPGAVPYQYDGRGFERIGTTTRRMSQPRYDALMRKRQNAASSWESQPAAGTKPTEMDAVRVRAVARPTYARANTASLTTLLASLGLKNTANKLIRAAVICFAKDPLPAYPQCTLRLVRFAGRKRGDTFVEEPREVHGNLFVLLEAAEQFVAKHVPTPSTVSKVGLRRVSRELVPIKALREVLVNAFVHRDYSQPATSVGLAIFDDRIEVENPGTFPTTIDPEKFLVRHASLPHNPLIAGIVHRTGLMEKWGTGGERIRNACKAAGTPPPRFTAEAGWVRVRFRASLPSLSGVTVGVLPDAPQALVILAAVAAQPRSRVELQTIVGLTGRSNFLGRYLVPLLSAGLLELETPESPRSPRQRYVLSKAGRRQLRSAGPAGPVRKQSGRLAAGRGQKQRSS